MTTCFFRIFIGFHPQPPLIQRDSNNLCSLFVLPNFGNLLSLCNIIGTLYHDGLSGLKNILCNILA